jgi:tetratricopeptide (TPR) repeat protein
MSADTGPIVSCGGFGRQPHRDRALDGLADAQILELMRDFHSGVRGKSGPIAKWSAIAATMPSSPSTPLGTDASTGPLRGAISPIAHGSDAPRTRAMLGCVMDLRPSKPRSRQSILAAARFGGLDSMRELSRDRSLVDLASDAGLVGREVEVAGIQRAWRNVVAGNGRIVLVSGEPGVGKTRLAKEVLAEVKRDNGLVLVGRCFEQQATIPFSPFSEAFIQALNTAPAESTANARQQWPELAHLIPDLAPVADRTGPERLASQESQLRVYRAGTAFMCSVANALPTVLLLDDLHSADGTSLDLLIYLARHIADARILIIGTYRDVEVGRQHPLEACLRELVRERLVEEIQLRGLTRTQTAELIRMRTGGAAPEKLVKLVHERTAGNPFFTEELIKALSEDGKLIETAWIDSLARSSLEIPRSIRSAVGHRIARLSTRAQELLSLASVIGGEFELDLLIASSEETEGELFDALDEVVAAGLVAGRGDGIHARYVFTHALIQQTLYTAIPVHRRRGLHRRVGLVLEARRAGRAASAAELARHFGAAGDPDRALRYSVEAGDQASSRFAHAEAVRGYEEAIDLLLDHDDPARLAEVQYRRGNELCDMNRLPEALSAYQTALALFKRLSDTTGQALVHRALGQLHQGRYDLVAASDHFNEALRLWPAEREDADFAWLLLYAARARVYGGQLGPERRSLVQRALKIAEGLGDNNLRARALVELPELEARPSARLPLLDRAEALARSVEAGACCTASISTEARRTGCLARSSGASPIACKVQRPLTALARRSELHLPIG